MRPRPPVAERTLPAVLEALASSDPHLPLVEGPSGRLDRQGSAFLAANAAQRFIDGGVSKGEPVAVMLDNGIEFLAVWWGLAWLGAVELPISPIEGEDRLLHILNSSRCRAIVCGEAQLEQLDALADQLPHLDVLFLVGDGSSTRFSTLPFAADARETMWAPPQLSGSDPVAVMYTSGSTGPAKGAILPHGQHYANGYQATCALSLAPHDRLYVALPLHHNMAQGYGVWPALVAGGSFHLATRFSPATFWEDVGASGSTVWPFVGAMLSLVEARTPAGADAPGPLRVGFGVPIPPALHERFERRFGLRLIHCYGSTEATIVTWDHEEPRTLGSAGRPFPGYEVVVQREDGTPAAPGEVGEICARSSEPAAMFTGYLQAEEATAKAWRDGWFHSGDRGRFDGDDKLWFVDRMGDVIRRLGEGISSYEVESAALAHPGVDLVAAYGVPSDLIEEEVMIAVVPAAGSNLTAAEIRRWCAGRLPAHAVPRFVELVEELPLTPTGKVQKFKLRERGVSTSTDDARKPQHEGRSA